MKLKIPIKNVLSFLYVCKLEVSLLFLRNTSIENNLREEKRPPLEKLFVRPWSQGSLKVVEPWINCKIYFSLPHLATYLKNTSRIERLKPMNQPCGNDLQFNDSIFISFQLSCICRWLNGMKQSRNCDQSQGLQTVILIS